jgi:leucine dehydrogenase
VSLTALIEAWDGVAAIVSFDRPTGTWVFICLHDTTLGPCTGGTRMKVYDAPEEGLLDAMRLAEGMTCKWASIDQGFGGGKAVLAIPRPLEGEEREGLLRRYARRIEALAGGFWTGEDLGTTTADFRILAEETRWVHGFDQETGEKLDPSPYTAQGVFRGVGAALERVFGSSSAKGRKVLIEGAGNVGGRLGELLAGAGAELLVSDLDGDRAEAFGRAHSATVVPLEAAYDTPCDVYAPCAVGATVNPETVPRLACRIIAGSANNQLSSPDQAEAVAERGILYVPDYVINSGGALSFALLAEGVLPGEPLLAEMDRVGRIVGEILDEAAAGGGTPLATARRRVERRLAEGKSSRKPIRRGRASHPSS